MDNTAQNVGGLASLREKYWSELNDSEKIERMRIEIKKGEYFKEKVYKLERKLSKLLNLISTHTHNEKGTATQHIDNFFHEDNELCSASSIIKRKDNEIYF